MAGESLATVFNAIAQTFAPELHKQWNRTSVLLGMLSAVGGVSEGKGKNVSFDLEFSGATAGTVAEGSDVAASEYASDVDVPGILPWCHYRSSFQVTETEVDALYSSIGTPEALVDLFGNRIMGCGAKIARAIETDAMSGTGVDASGNPTLIGIFGGALSATGTYAGVNPATYSEWAGNVVANGGVARALTTDLMEQVDAGIFLNSSEPWDAVMTTAGVVRKYTGIFTNPTTPMIRFNDSNTGAKYGTGYRLDGQSQPEDALFKGRPIFRNAVATTGQAAFLNFKHIAVKYLPRRLSQLDRDFMAMVGIEGSSGGGEPIQATAIPMRVANLAKTGDSYKVTMKATLNMCVTRRNAQGLLTDILET